VNNRSRLFFGFPGSSNKDDKEKSPEDQTGDKEKEKTIRLSGLIQLITAGTVYH